jgi:hypothetical protein
MDTALRTLEQTIDGSSCDSDAVPNVVAVLAMNVRAQHEVLRAMAQRVEPITSAARHGVQ